jgi:hypothetical protein
MAVIAKIIAGKMLGMFPFCSQTVMALITFERCSYKLAGKVTTGTIDKFMPAS